MVKKMIIPDLPSDIIYLNTHNYIKRLLATCYFSIKDIDQFTCALVAIKKNILETKGIYQKKFLKDKTLTEKEKASYRNKIRKLNSLLKTCEETLLIYAKSKAQLISAINKIDSKALLRKEIQAAYDELVEDLRPDTTNDVDE